MKNIIKKSLVFVLSAAMALSFAMPAKKASADTYDQVFDIYNSEDLTAAKDVINNADSGNFKINVKADFTSGVDTFEFTKNKVTIDGENHSIKSCVTGGAVAAWNDGTEVSVYNAIFEGVITNDNPGVFYAINEGTIIMNDGVIIRNNEGNNYMGGGVTVANGKFVMNGGTIENCGVKNGSNCYGGGVAVFNGSIFIMNGGTIKDCYVTNTGSSQFYAPYTAGGGVCVSLFSSFVFNGGTIEDCYAQGGGAVGGGVAIQAHLEDYYEYGGQGNVSSNFEMNGGTITGCSATSVGGGVYVGGYYIQPVPAGTIVQTVIPEGHTRGIYINGGTISDNDASGQYGGGGICLFWVKPTVTIQNATISDNNAVMGGGILVFDNYTAATISGCTITDNHSTDVGGGVCVMDVGSSSGTTLNNCTITGNTSEEIGAGVFYNNESPLKISGANIIQNNTYNGVANNLNIYMADAPVQVIGSLAGSKIGLSDPTLWDDGISDEEATVASDYLTSGYKATNPSLVPKDAFTSDHKTWYPDYSEDGNEVRLVKKTNNSKIKGGNILVDGLIGVTLWVDLDASTEAEREAYSMKFTLDDHTGSGEVQTAEYDSKKTAENTSTGDTYYGFTFEDVKAPQMADEITAELLQDGDKVGVEKVYSVEQYAENIINKDSTKQDYKDFLKPMLNYGAFAQKYFNYNKSDLANKNNDMSDDVYEQTVDSKYELSEEGGLSGIAVKHFGMALNDGVDLHFEFTADSNVNMDEYTAVLNDDPNKKPMFIDDNDQPTHELIMPFTELETQGVKTYYVNVYNIPAHRYDDTMTVTLYKKSDPATTFKIHFSVLSYAYEIIEKNADVPEGVNVEDLKNLLKSMVLYNVWAEKYFNKYPGEYIRTKRVITEKA